MSDRWGDGDDAAIGGQNAAPNVPEFSVSELSNAIKRTVEDRFGYVRVRAELSGVKIPASGHVYFALKDEKSVLNGIMWRGNAAKLRFRPEDGLEVVATGKLTTYGARSQYQMVVDQMVPAGAGALMALLEERKKKLAAEGLFAAENKVPLPYLPKVIGVVTSPTGAVIRDILHRLRDRFPSRVLVWGVRVQGDGAADEISRAIEGFNALSDDPAENGGVPRPDLLIVARGGGSIEDLWSFNEETVVRAAARSAIPLLSAVGHETDTTLIDYASDRRAPTPTGAAEMAVPVRGELLATVHDLARRLALVGARQIEDRRERLTALSRALPTPRDILGLATQKLDDLSDRLPLALRAAAVKKETRLARATGALSPQPIRTRLAAASDRLSSLAQRLRPAMVRLLDRDRHSLVSTARLLDSLSHKAVLKRGFALVMDADGALVTKASDASEGQAIRLDFQDGSLATVVTGAIKRDGDDPASSQSQTKKPSQRPKKATSTGKKDPRQGSLL